MSEEIKVTENQSTEPVKRARITTVCLESNVFNISFVNNLYSALYRNAITIKDLRRKFGTNVNDDLSAYMSFLEMCGDRVPYKEDVYFLVACLLIESESPNNAGKERKYVSFESLLRRLYDVTNSTDRKICNFLNTDYSNKSLFIPQFVHLARRAVKEMYSSERLDYVRLINDLCFWDAEEHLVRKRWARTIVLNIPEKEKVFEPENEEVFER